MPAAPCLPHKLPHHLSHSTRCAGSASARGTVRKRRFGWSRFAALLGSLAFVASASELPVIAERRSAGGLLDITLSFEQATASIAGAGTGSGAFSFKTRLFNGSLPGPTLRFRRGDTVRLRLLNNLDPKACGFTSGDAVESGVINTIRDPCVTNMHTHGLHISTDEPQDNVFVQIKPGKSYDYEYKIPTNHLGGTHWYHPHHHGSTAGHVDGGASGLIIVEDEDSDNLPAAFRSMPEHVILLTAIGTGVADTEAAGGGTWMTEAPPAAVLLANGLVSPTLTIAAGSGTTWIRLRFAFSAVGHALAIAIPEACTAMLMAKDGVYLPYGARATTVLKFAPGNRADIALSCAIGTHQLTSSPADAGDGGGGGGAGIASFPAGTVLSVVWEEALGQQTSASLVKLTYTAPSYLRDLTSTEPDEIFTNGVTVNGAQGCTFECGQYQHGVILQYMSVDKIQEFAVNAAAHPFHMHINHMQLVTVSGGGWVGWHHSRVTLLIRFSGREQSAL